MKPKKTISKICILVCFFCAIKCEILAQNTLITSGNYVSGSGGTASYSLGQIIQEKTTGTNGSAIQGIQFNFYDTSLSIIDLATNLEISSYPNPTTSILNIELNDFKPNIIEYRLYNISGNQIKTGLITNRITKININNLPIATYILKVKNKKNQKEKTFKIIKK